MDVVYFGSRAVYQDFVTAINSLRAHTPSANVYAIIEDDSLPIPDVHYIDWRKQTWFSKASPNYYSKWTYVGLARAALAKVFPDKEKILSIDVDTIVCKDISELWDIDLTGFDVAACRERMMTSKPYFNNGVSLFNLEQIRKTGKDNAMIQLLNTIPLPYVSQDAMHLCCNFRELNSKWNACKFTHPCKDPYILHFADRTDWRDLPEVKQYATIAINGSPPCR